MGETEQLNAELLKEHKIHLVIDDIILAVWGVGAADIRVGIKMANKYANYVLKHGGRNG